VSVAKLPWWDAVAEIIGVIFLYFSCLHEYL